MFYDYKRTNKILKELGITPNQAWFCMMIMEQDFKYKNQLFKDYTDEHGGIEVADIAKLEELGYIENFSDSTVPKTIAVERLMNLNKTGYVKTFRQSKDAVILSLFIVTPKFKDLIFIDPEIAAEELQKVFPAWMMIKDRQTGKLQRTFLQGIPADKEPFYDYYATIHGGDILKHRYICEMFSHFKKYVTEGKVNGMGIIKALEGKLWKHIKELIELEKDELGESYESKQR